VAPDAPERDPDNRPVVTRDDTLASGGDAMPNRWIRPVALGLVVAAAAAAYLPGQLRQFRADRAEAHARSVLKVATRIEDVAGGDSLTMNVHVTNTGPRPIRLAGVSFAGIGITVQSARLPADTLDPGQGGRATVEATIACGEAAGGATTVVRARTADGKMRTTTARAVAGATSLEDVVALACGGTPSG
jgi:hypothetical protein